VQYPQTTSPLPGVLKPEKRMSGAFWLTSVSAWPRFAICDCTGGAPRWRKRRATAASLSATAFERCHVLRLATLGVPECALHLQARICERQALAERPSSTKDSGGGLERPRGPHLLAMQLPSAGPGCARGVPKWRSWRARRAPSAVELVTRDASSRKGTRRFRATQWPNTRNAPSHP